MKTRTLKREVLQPATKRLILLWLVTGGRRGKLWEFDWTLENEYSPEPDPRTKDICLSRPPTHIGCRSIYRENTTDATT